MVANATINLDALRYARQRFELYAKSYADHSFYPANNLSEATPNRAHFIDNQRLTIEKLKDKGVI
jgi:hypothetical protein